MSNQKKLFAIATVVLIALFMLGAYLFKNTQLNKATDAVASNPGALIRPYSPTIGNPLLKVTVVEFLDPECEACAYFHPFVKSILNKYEGRVRYVVRYAPFHPNSKFAIKILEAARKQNKYWETLDLLFKNLPKWGNHHNPQPQLIWTFLPDLDLDIAQMKKDLDNPETDKMIRQEIEDGATFGVRQTPTFFINGRPLQKFGPKELEAAISSQL